MGCETKAASDSREPSVNVSWMTNCAHKNLGIGKFDFAISGNRCLDSVEGWLGFSMEIPAYLSGSAFDMQGNTLLGTEADGWGDSWNCWRTGRWCERPITCDNSQDQRSFHPGKSLGDALSTAASKGEICVAGALRFCLGGVPRGVEAVGIGKEA